MTISSAINVIQSKQNKFCQAELKYNEQDPLSMEIIIDLIEDGLLLRFDSSSQRLLMIEIYDIYKLILFYSNIPFCAPNTLPTFVHIYDRFGPSYPGKFDPKKSCYYLHYAVYYIYFIKYSSPC